MKKIFLMVFVLAVLTSAGYLYAEEELLFGFENGLEGWDVPEWAYEKPDHVQREIGQSSDFASEGASSLEIKTEFPGGSWAGAIVEIMQYFDWTDYNAIACDVYLPEGSPTGLKGKIILTVGDTWKWVEMSRDFQLIPGEWVTIKGDLMPGSIDWRRVQVDDTFRQDIRKVDVRVTSGGKPAYTGSIYLDNVRVIK